MDHGTDFLGNDVPPEELNRLVEGKDYGWPRCFGQQRIDPTRDKPEGMTREAFCAKTEPAALDFPAHSSPLGFVFYTGSQFPPEYRNDASWLFMDPEPQPAERFQGRPRQAENGKVVAFGTSSSVSARKRRGTVRRPFCLAVAKEARYCYPMIRMALSIVLRMEAPLNVGAAPAPRRAAATRRSPHIPWPTRALDEAQRTFGATNYRSFAPTPIGSTIPRNPQEFLRRPK